MLSSRTLSHNARSNYGVAQEGDPNYVLSLTDDNGNSEFGVAPGAEIKLYILLDNNGGDIQGWSYGVTHDTSFLEILGAVNGHTTKTVNNGGLPDFDVIELFPDGVIQGYEVLTPPVGRNVGETLRQIQAFQLVRESKGTEATPSGWKPGKKTLKPGPDLVGKVWEVWKTEEAFD